MLDRLQQALSDRYTIERELGHGGMAVVYLAQDLKHHRRVAIKVLRPELAYAIGPERFLREIEIAARLTHPHILPLHDSGNADGALYYVMPYIEGESLRDRLKREGKLPVDEALRITAEIADALTYAHEAGLVHRDIKPENILLQAGHAVVSDFGIARAVSAAGGDKLTETGLAVGTPAYMSPEQSLGDSGVDARSDVYSLGCLLFEMLTGRTPFAGSAQAMVAGHRTAPVPTLSSLGVSVPPAVQATLNAALAKERDQRPATARALSQALTGDGTTRTTRVSPRTRRVALTAAAALGVALAIWWGVTRFGTGRTPTITAVAVLPFADLSSSPDSSYLAPGMTEGLVADLAQVASLKLKSRSPEAAGRASSLSQLAGELGIDAVVSGSVRRAGDTVWARVSLLRARDSSVLFAKEYQSSLGRLPDLQREITTAITGSIGVRLQGNEETRLATRREVDQRAYEAYLKGRFLMDREELEQARAQFEQAGRLAPDWAPPRVGLANYYAALPFYSDLPPVEVLPKARAALAQALELDETLAEAHAANAYIRAYYEWDWRAAEREFRRALELRPNYPDAYFSYGRFLASRRRIDEAIAQVERAVELDPLSLSLQANRALLDYFAGRYDEAEGRLREILKTDSTHTLVKWGLALVAEQQGKPEQAIAILESIAGQSLLRRSTLAHAYAVAGRRDRAEIMLAAFRSEAAKKYVPSYYFALVYTGLGQHEQALRHLERAYEERSTVLAYLRIDPRLAPLRSHPRFLALVKRMEGED